MKILPYGDDKHFLLADLSGLRSLVLELVLVALAGAGENVRFWRRRLRLRGLGPGSLYSFAEANTDAQRSRRCSQGILRRMIQNILTGLLSTGICCLV